MADQKISALTAITGANVDAAADLLVIVDTSATADKNITPAQFFAIPSQTLVTPTLGVAAATSINKVTITAPSSNATLTLATGSSLITSGANAITLTSTGATNVTLPTTGTLMANPMTTGGDVIYGGASGVATRLANGSAGQVLTSAGTTLAPTWATPSAGGITVGTTAITSGTATRLLYETSGNVVGEISGATSDGTTLTMVAPVLGTPASGTLTNCTGLPAAGVVGTAAILGANTFTALQTITQASANAGILASTGYSLTGSNATAMLSFAGTLNTSGNPSIVSFAVTNTAAGATTKAMTFNGGAAGATELFSFAFKPNTPASLAVAPTNPGLAITNGVDTISISGANGYYSQIHSNHDLVLTYSDGCVAVAGPQLAGGAFPTPVNPNGLNMNRSGFLWGRHAGQPTSGAWHVFYKIDTHTADDTITPMDFIGQSAFTTATTNIVGGNITLTAGGGAASSAGAANGGNVLLDGGAAFGTGVVGNIVVGATRGSLILASTTAPTAAAAQISLSGATQTTIGANGGASALTVLPLGYIKINVAGTAAIIPYYNA